MFCFNYYSMKIEDSNLETNQDILKTTALQSVDIVHNLMDKYKSNQRLEVLKISSYHR